MNNQWVTITEAANISGKSTTTIRRAVASLTKTEKTQYIKRVQIVGAGGEKILISRAFIVSRWTITEPHALSIEQESTNERKSDQLVLSLEKQVFILNREIESKTRIIEDYSRLASDLTNNIREQTILNATLQNKILSLGAGSKEPPPQANGLYWLVIFVAIALLFALVLYLLFG
jgi:transcriptional antiterminator